jgi:hypothetical protein
MKRSQQIVAIVSACCLAPSTASADVVWPALYVADSHYRTWYIIIIGLFLEAVVLRRWLKLSTVRAFYVSIVTNAFSATVGLWLLAFGMLGWHFVVDRFVRGTFNLFNDIVTLLVMFLGSIVIEATVARAAWRFPFRATLPVFLMGNVLSYGAVLVDLFFLGGWHRQM